MAVVLNTGSNSEISAIKVCKYNQYGYCKKGLLCFWKHIDRKCENDPCVKTDCKIKHPRKYRYCLEYSYCNYGQYCKYTHEDLNEESWNWTLKLVY